MKKMCQYFYVLDPVMGARPSATAPYTNEDSSAVLSDTEDDSRE